MVAPALSLTSHATQQVIGFGRQLAQAGVSYQGSVHHGLLKAIESQTEAPADTRGDGGKSMTTEEFRGYLEYMGKRLDKAAGTIRNDKENPHAEEIAEGAFRTAAFVKALSESRERAEGMQQKMQEELRRQEMETYQEKREKEQEVDKKKEGISLGSSALGIFDELVTLLAGKPEDRMPAKDMIKDIVHGLQQCTRDHQRYDARNTPAVAIPEREAPALPPKK